MKLEKYPALQDFNLVLSSSVRNALLRKTHFIASFVFSFSLLVLFPFAFGIQVIGSPGVRYGVFWMIQEFAVVLILNQLFESERRGGVLDFWISAKLNKASIVFAKSTYCFMHLCVQQVPILFAWILLFNIPAADLGYVYETLIPVLLLFNLGTSVLGAVLSALTVRSSSKEVLLPILFFPMQASLLLACTTLCLADFPEWAGTGTVQMENWWLVLWLFPVISTSLAILLADHLFEG